MWRRLVSREEAAEEARMWRAPSAAARRIVIDIWKRRGRRRRVRQRATSSD
jgi:hypothetical protein